MNIKRLLEQLSTIFSITDEEIKLLDKLNAIDRKNYDEYISTSYQIKRILTDTVLDEEQKRNHLEAFLIEKILSEENIQRRDALKLALKISLHNRGYHTDDLGQLEQQLLLLPYQSIYSPNTYFSKDSGGIQPAWKTINNIRVELSNCFYIPESYCSMLERLAKVIRFIIDAQRDADACILTYLDKTLLLIDKYMVQKNDKEWSIWVSAAVECTDYLNDLRSHSPPNESEISIQTLRLNYFLTFTQAFNEPISPAIELQLSKTSKGFSAGIFVQNLDDMREKSTSSEVIDNTPKIDELIFKACELISADNKESDFLRSLMNIASDMEKAGHSIGTFFRVSGYILAEPLSSIQWKTYFEKLQCIAVPMRWRSEITTIWIALAEFFAKNYGDNCKFYLQAAIACIKQIHKTSFNSNPEEILDIETIENLVGIIQKIKQQEHKTAPMDKRVLIYSKQSQYLLCKILIRHPNVFNEKNTTALDNFITELLESNNPYCFSETAKLLNSNSLLRDAALRVINKKYNLDTSNPRVFCEQVLQSMNCNNYLIIWGPLFCGVALNPHYQPNFSDIALKEEFLYYDNIQYERCIQMRQQLRLKLFNPQEDTPLILCGFSYLTAVEQKLFELSFRLMFNHQKSLLSETFKFTQNRPGLSEVIYALLFFYEGNYIAAQQMAELSLKYPANANSGENRPSYTSNPSNMASAVGTPVKGNSPEFARKFVPPPPKKSSARLVMMPVQQTTSESPDTSPRGEPSTPINVSPSVSSPNLSKIAPLKLLRDSDPSGLPKGRFSSTLRIGASRSPSRSPSSSIDYSSALVSPRALSASPSKVGSNTPILDHTPRASNHEQKSSTSMGHLIKAMIIWETRLSNNKYRSENDISHFQTELEATQKLLDPEVERNFITGMRWLYYLMSSKDSLWLMPSDQKLYQNNEQIVIDNELDRIKVKEGNLNEADRIKIENERLKEFTIMKIIKYYLTNKSKPTKFPPAILIIYQYLWPYLDKYPQTDSRIARKEKEALASVLKEAVFDGGYFSAIPTYIKHHSSAHPDKYEESEMLSSGLTSLDRVTLIKKALILSNTCFPFTVDNVKVITDHCKEVEDSDRKKVEVIQSYKKEVPQGFKHQFECLPVKLLKDNAQLCIDFIENENERYDCRLLLICIDDVETETNDLESIYQLFLRAARIYSYCKKVNLVQDEFISRKDTYIVVKHADIATLGILFLFEGKNSSLLPKFDPTPLCRFLNEAKSLNELTWQWTETYQRLQKLTLQPNISIIDEAIPDVDTDELTNKPGSLSPKSEQISLGGSPRGILSPPLPQNRGSRIQMTSRRGSTADLTGSLPSSPRSKAGTPSKRDSGKVSIPDGSTGSLKNGRARATTDVRSVFQKNK